MLFLNITVENAFLKEAQAERERAERGSKGEHSFTVQSWIKTTCEEL